MREIVRVRRFPWRKAIGASLFLAACGLLICAFVTARTVLAGARQAGSPAAHSSSSLSVAAEADVTSYTLPPDLYRKAHHLGQIAFWGQIASFIYSVAILLIILKARVAPKFRDWAERAGGNRSLQAIIFTSLLVVTVDVAGIPLDAADQWISRRFGLSIQAWPSWLWDWTKSALLAIALSIFLAWLLYAAIRKRPRDWWLHFWAATIPITLLLVLAQPVFVDPLFHKFEPLAQKDAPLATALEGMVQRTGENIPVSRMFWMGASEKTTELNAYVTGIGGSKRIVVWDTTIAKLDTPETVFVVGHEMGHYVLNHVSKGIAAGEAFLFLLLYLGYRAFAWILARHGARWGIREPGDWASLPALLLLLTIFTFAASPVENAFSRHIEHQADQYGLEATHGLTPNSPQVAARSFEELGVIDLEDPAPNPVDVFMFYTHPKIADRIHFALAYDPWAEGGHGEFVP